MSRRRRRVVALALLTLLPTACGAGDGTTGEEATTMTPLDTGTSTAPLVTRATTVPREPFVIWADEVHATALELIGETFSGDTGIPVVVETVQFGQIRERLGMAEEGPDVFVGAHEWIGDLHASGLLAEVDLQGREGEFHDVAIDAFSLTGTQYGLPYALENFGLFYNTDLVPTAPTTWDELTAACDDLAGVNVCVAVPTLDAVANQAFVQGFGGYIFRYGTAQGFDTSDVGLDNEGAIDGANWLDQAVKDGYLSSDVESSNLGDVFVSGESAFLWSGPEDVARIEASGVPYDVTTFPPDGDAVPMPLLGVRGFMISASSELQVAAQLFLTDYVATHDAMMSLFEAEKRGPAYVPSFEAALDEDPQIAIFAQVGADPGLLLPNVANAAAVTSALRGAFAVIFNQAYEGDLSGPAEVMAEAATRVRASVDGG